MLPRLGLPLSRCLATVAVMVTAATSLAACSSAGSAYNTTAEAERFPVHGIDVSKYQGAIDWPVVARSGVKFAYIKATEGGDRTDTMFATNWSGARASGIATGAYHFYYFCRRVEDQIAWFQQHVPPAADALPPVLDIEWNSQSKTCRSHPPAAQIRADMRRFLDAMQTFYGKRPVVYTDIGFHRDILAAGDLPDYPFWLRSVKAHPSERYSNRGFAFWQYTATGQVPGVRGNVDRNAFAGSQQQWDAFLQSNARSQPTAVASAPVPASTVVVAATPAARATIVAAAPAEDLDLAPVPATMQTFQEPALNGVY